MVHLYRLLSCILLAGFLVSCTSSPQRDGDETIDDAAVKSSASYRFEAWQPDTSAGYEAIKVLLDEVDALIASDAYNAASDKLERVLRIKPKYAPAWSRLSWLALQMDLPQRAIQMAKRSNSFAFSAPELQRLNWSFIRTASKTLNDEKLYETANQQIESLNSY